MSRLATFALALLFGCEDLDARFDPSPSWAYRVGDVESSDGPPPRICSTLDDCRATELACGDRATCAKLESGQVACWGQGLRSFNSSYPASADGGTSMHAIDVSQFLCGVDDRGGVTCSGQGAGGLMDDSVFDDLRPIGFRGFASPPIDVTAGASLACAVEEGGAVECWGVLSTDDRPGLDGDDRNDFTGPRGIEGLGGPARSVEISPFGNGASALFADGTAWTWAFLDTGWGAAGRVEGLEGVRQITAAADGPPMCALFEDGTVACRELDFSTEGGPTERWVPIDGITGASQIATLSDAGLVGPDPLPGPISAGCAVLTSGSVRCWGDRERIGLPPMPGGVATDIPDITDAVEVCLQSSFARAGCARLRNGRVRCWGDVYANGNMVPPGPVEGLE